jgi:hypothetical protein
MNIATLHKIFWTTLMVMILAPQSIMAADAVDNYLNSCNTTLPKLAQVLEARLSGQGFIGITSINAIFNAARTGFVSPEARTNTNNYITARGPVPCPVTQAPNINPPFPVTIATSLAPSQGPIEPSTGKAYCVSDAGRGLGIMHTCGSQRCAWDDYAYGVRQCVVNYRSCNISDMRLGEGFGQPQACWNGTMSCGTISATSQVTCVRAASVNTAQPATTTSNTNNNNTNNAGTPATASPTTSQIIGFDKLENPLGGTGISTISGGIEKILNLVLRIAIPFVTLMLIYTGFLFVRAQGDPGKLTEARKTFVAVIIGAVLLMGAAIIANTIAKTVEKIGSSVTTQ